MTRNPPDAHRGAATAAADAHQEDGNRRQEDGDGQISHAIARVARAHRAAAGQILRRIGLYPGQELLMMRLWESGPQRQSELIEGLCLDASTVTRMVQRLEQGGFVTRRPDPKDGRAVLVETTRAGEALRPEVAAMWQELEHLTLAGVGAEDRACLARLLAAVEGNLTA